MTNEDLKLRGGNDRTDGLDIKLYGPSHKTNANDIHISTPTKQSGYYKVNNSMHWRFSTKPSRWNRFWTRLTLGWIWVDTDDNSQDIFK